MLGALHFMSKTEAPRQIEDLLGQFDYARDLRLTTGQQEAASAQVVPIGAMQFLANEMEQLLVARLDDFGERQPRQASRRRLTHALDLDFFVRGSELR